MKKRDTYKIYFWIKIAIANGIIFYLANLLYPKSVVFGNVNLTSVASIVVSSLFLTLVISQVDQILKSFKIKIKKDIYWGIIYGLVNVICLWLFARFGGYTGLGITSFAVAISLGIILNLVQYLIWKLFSGKILL